MTDIRARLARIEGEIRDVSEVVMSISDLSDKYYELNRRLERMNMTMGALAEAVLSRVALDELRAKGYSIRSYHRNYRVDEEDIDHLVEAQKDQNNYYFIVEVKDKPTQSDVGGLLAKVDVFEASTGIRAKPVLAGIWVSGRVREYAERRGVWVLDP